MKPHSNNSKKPFFTSFSALLAKSYHKNKKLNIP